MPLNPSSVSFSVQHLFQYTAFSSLTPIMAAPAIPQAFQAALDVREQFLQFPFDAPVLAQVAQRSRAKGTSRTTQQDIPYSWLRQMLKPNTRIKPELVQFYLELICHHHNRRTVRRADFPTYLWMERTFIDRLQYRGTNRHFGLQHGTEALNDHPLLLNFTRQQIRDNFLGMEHIFIPIERSRTGRIDRDLRRDHSALLVISLRPRAHGESTIEYFDCLHLDGSFYFALVLEWLEFELGPNFGLYSWAVREKEVPLDNSKNSDIHTCIHAYNVAFGHGRASPHFRRDQIFTPADITPKRRRMVVEFINESFEYPQAQGFSRPLMYSDEYLGMYRTRNSPTRWRRMNNWPRLWGPNWIQMTWVERCRWAIQHGRDVKDRSWIMTRAGVITQTPAGTSLKILQVRRRRVLRDIVHDMGILNRRSTRSRFWSKKMLRIAIDFELESILVHPGLWNRVGDAFHRQHLSRNLGRGLRRR